MINFSCYGILKVTFFLFSFVAMTSAYQEIYDGKMYMADRIGDEYNIDTPYYIPLTEIVQPVAKRRLVVRVPFGRNPARGQLSRMYNSFHNVKDKKMYSGMRDIFY
uniref:Uncharacterized protein n=1 Tax=Strongyloides papillosus TaxID=174720 RepID=A0A0N5C2H1_STREA